MKEIEILTQEIFKMFKKGEETNIILKDFVERTISPLTFPKETIFIHTHYWLFDAKNWAKGTPLCFLLNEHDVFDFIQSFYIFFLLRRGGMRERTQRKFSITSFMFKKLPQVQFLWQKIPRDEVKEGESLVNVQMLGQKSATVKSIHMNIPEIDLSDLKERVLQIFKKKSLLDSLRKLIEKSIKEAKERNEPYFFLPPLEFNDLIGEGLKCEQVERLSAEFSNYASKNGMTQKLSYDLIQAFQQHPVLREWQVENGDLNDFAVVAMAHNLLPSWQHWYALSVIPHGVGGIYVCSIEEIPSTRLDSMHIALNLRFRLPLSE